MKKYKTEEKISIRSGRYFFDNGLEITEVTKKTLSKFLKEIIKLNYGQLK